MTENTEIALHQRAVVAIGYEKTVAELEQLAAKSADIVEITNADGYNQVHQARVQLKFTRIDIEKKGKAAREDATQFRDAVIDQTRRKAAGRYARGMGRCQRA